MPAKKKTAESDAPKAAAKKAPAKKAAKKAVAKKTAKTAATKAASAKAKSSPSHEDIAREAYLNYRGRKARGEHGDAKGDWHHAEKKLKK